MDLRFEKTNTSTLEDNKGKEQTESVVLLCTRVELFFDPLVRQRQCVSHHVMHRFNVALEKERLHEF